MTERPVSPLRPSEDFVVRVRDLHKAYRRGSTTTPVLSGIELDIRRGQCVYLAGPSGSGKTTLLSILGCILSPDRGQVRILGEDLERLSAERKITLRRDRLGFIFQRFQLVRGLTAIENVCVPLALRGKALRAARNRGMALLDAVGLADKAAARPAQLSAGQCQRVAMARALIGNPDLILADEPTGSLDARNGQEVMELLRHLAAEQARTIVVVTHDQRIFRYADRVFWLEDGRVAESLEPLSTSGGLSRFSFTENGTVPLRTQKAFVGGDSSRRFCGHFGQSASGDASYSEEPICTASPVATGGRITMRRRHLLVGSFVVTAFAPFLMSAHIVSPPRPTVHATQPESAPKQHSIFAVGRIEGASLEIGLRPELAGRIAEMPVHEGDQVRKGAVLFRLDDSQYRQEVALADAGVALAKAELERLVDGAHKQERAEANALCQAKMAELEHAKSDWRRVQKLLVSRVVSQEEADLRRSQVASLDKEVQAAKAHNELLDAPARNDEIHIRLAQIQAAQARLELAKVQFDHAQVCAPCDGQILKADVAVGELVGPNSAEPAVVMADLSSYRVRTYVEELDAPRVQVGMTAIVTADGMPGKQFHGRVSRLSPRMVPKQMSSDRPSERLDTKTREVWITLEPSSALVVGLRVDVTIETDPPGPVPVFIPAKTGLSPSESPHGLPGDPSAAPSD